MSVKNSQNELVIFLRPIVVSNPTLESEELRQFQRLLPLAPEHSLSLLLKALKQAETANTGRNTPSADLELEPVTAMPGKQGREWVEPPTMLFGNSGLPREPSRGKSLRWPRLSLVPLTALLAAIIALVYGAYLYFALQPQDAPPLIQTPPPAAQPKPRRLVPHHLPLLRSRRPRRQPLHPNPRRSLLQLHKHNRNPLPRHHARPLPTPKHQPRQPRQTPCHAFSRIPRRY
jgi:hypothetical protein